MDGPRILQEKKNIQTMVQMYCQGKHGSGDELCENCRALLAYAWLRLERCSFGEEKPTCAKCPIHCYRPDMRAKVIDVMRYSGPRMVFKNPLEALRHLLRK
jgi:hypothetical protein